MCFIPLLYHAWSTLRGRLASGLSTRPPHPISLRASLLHVVYHYHVYMYARVVLTSRASTYSAFGPACFLSYPMGIGLAPFEFRGNWECVQAVRSFSHAW